MMAFRPFSAAPFPAALLLACAALLAVLAPAARAQAVTLHSSADSVTVGERFLVSIVAVHDARAEPVFPDPAAGDTLLGDLEVLARREAFTRALGAGTPGLQVDSVVYEVTTFALDTAAVSSLILPFVAGEDTVRAAAAPLLVFVRSLVPPEAQDIRDLAPLVDFPRALWPFVLLGLLALLLIAGLVLYVRKRRRDRANAPPRPAPAASPYEEAVQRLRTLEGVDLARPENVKPFYVELSDLLRGYLARRLDVPALEETTRELVRELQARAARRPLSDDAVGHVRAVLELADLAKFADARPPADESRAALDEARLSLKLIEETLRAPAPATDGTTPPAPGLQQAPHPDVQTQ